MDEQTQKGVLAAFNRHDLFEFRGDKISRKGSFWKIVEKE